MDEKMKCLIAVIILFGFCSVAEADPPFPAHTIEGNSGLLITSTAYLTNPPEQGEALGSPSFSASALFLAEKDLTSFAMIENFWGRIEIGYAYEHLGLGDLPNDVRTILGVSIGQHVGLHNLNCRVMAIEEGGFDCSWMPAVTFGTHLKWSEGQTRLDEDLGGLLDRLGSDHSRGTELTLVASKTVTDILPWPIVLSAGVRNGDAIETGLFGFAGERRTTLEGNIYTLLTEELAFGAEYRQKPAFLEPVSIFGYDLVKAESDWFALALAYKINDMTFAGAFANLGNLMNHREENVYGMQLKYDF